MHDSNPNFLSYKVIPDTEGCYRISRDGDVLTCRHSALDAWPGWWIKMKCCLARPEQPYKKVSIIMNGALKNGNIAQLLLLTFVGYPPSEKHIAMHRDGDSLNDKLENLVWSTVKEAKQAQIVRGTISQGDACGGRSRFTETQVRAIRKVLACGVKVNTFATAAGIPQPRIREIAKGIIRNPSKHNGLVCPHTGAVYEENSDYQHQIST